MSEQRRAGILSIGSYAPAGVLTNDDLSRMVDTSDDWIVPRTGIRERRISDKDEFTSDMAAKAAKAALQRAEMSPADVSYVLLATATPDNIFPNTACWVQKHLGIPDVPTLDISTACSGFVYALELAAALVNSGAYKNVLTIGAEKLSAVTNYTDRQSCILFGDGAGAAIVGPVEDKGRILCSRSGSHFEYEVLCIPAGGVRMPASAETIEKRLHTISLQGRAVYRFAVQKFVEMANEACERAGISPQDLDLVVPHQANLNIIESAMKRVGVPMEKVLLNIERYGNTSSASIPIALDEAFTHGRIRRGDHVLMLAFGGGLSWGYNLLRW